jgi:hypothetical protein
MPGDDYYTNFKKGDPYVKIDMGFARLPGAGYAALHPELKDVNPEDYPEINKLNILADVAPYSREYNTSRLVVGKQAQGNTELQIEYEKILERVRQTKESVIAMQDRHFTAQVEELEGTVDSVSPGGLTLKEYPGRKFQFSSVGMSAADMSARILGEHNNMTRSFRPVACFATFSIRYRICALNQGYRHIYDALCPAYPHQRFPAWDRLCAPVSAKPASQHLKLRHSTLHLIRARYRNCAIDTGVLSGAIFSQYFPVL